ncbi:MAG: hypothetical protein FWD47_15370 [Treponema sp.]|nr:hypothetical protein [Treponema sp.]
MNRTKSIIVAVGFSLAMVFASPVWAQGIYFDAGLGVGSATTKMDGTNFSKLAGPGVSDVATELGLKIGYGPVADKPLYIVGETGGIGHRFDDGSDYIQFNSYLIGPGVIYYPIPLVQLGFSVGLSWIANQTNMPMLMFDSDGGYAYNFSAAVDLGNSNHGCLIGLKYTSTTNELQISRVSQKSSMIGLFVRYTYRKKGILLTE